MAYKTFDGTTDNTGAESAPMTLTIDGGSSLDLPDASFVRDADIQRDGMDLVLDGPDGTIVIEGYFAAEPMPNLVAPGGETLTADLVESFARSPSQYADAGSMNDASPVGSVQEVSGDATVTHLDGTVEVISTGTPIFQGDVIETSGEGAVNIVFIDETSFAVSDNARLAIDEYVFDPATQSGSTNFSVLKGVFVFTSGLIGRDDPDDVEINTPVGSIGIRGTIIMGDVDSGEITVVEGAIVLHDLQGNEMTLAGQFETGRFDPAGGEIEHMGQMSADHMMQKFASMQDVSPDLFSSLGDSASENAGDDGTANQAPQNAEDGDAGEGEGAEAASDGENAPADETKTQDQAGAEVIDEALEGAEGDPLLGDGESPAGEGDLPPPPPPPGSDPFAGDDSGFADSSGFGDDATSSEPLPPGSESSGPNSGPGGPAGGGDGTTETIDTTTSDPNAPPPPPLFDLDVQLFPIVENDSDAGVLLARITGLNTASTNVQLLGAHAGDVDLFQIGINTWEIRTNGSGPFDFESFDPSDVTLRATSSNGSVIQGDFFPLVTDVNEAPDFISNVTPNEFFAASTGAGSANPDWSHHFDHDFFDQDFGANGDLTFTLSTATQNELNLSFGPTYLETGRGLGLDGAVGGGDDGKGWEFDTTTGELSLWLKSGGLGVFGGDGSFNIEVTASDGVTADALNSFTFNAIDSDTAFTPSMVIGSGQIVSAPATNDTVTFSASSGSKFFGNGGDDMVNLGSASSGNTINTGDGIDTIIITSTAINNVIVAGYGDDTIFISDVKNKIFGTEGNDDLILDLNLTSVLSDLATASGNVIDGGFGEGDSLIFSADATPGTANTIDFRTFDDTFFRGIESIDLLNGQDNTLVLNFQDIFQMTDNYKTLVIGAEASDSIQIDLTSESVFHEVDTNGNDVYYIEGATQDVTLIIDGTANVAFV